MILQLNDSGVALSNNPIAAKFRVTRDRGLPQLVNISAFPVTYLMKLPTSRLLASLALRTPNSRFARHPRSATWP